MLTTDQTIDHGTLRRTLARRREFEPGATGKRAPDRRSITAAERMKRAHAAAAYDTWFLEQVQASIDDPRASLGDDQARARMAARRQALLKMASSKPAGKACGKTYLRPRRIPEADRPIARRMIATLSGNLRGRIRAFSLSRSFRHA